jgi:L-aspartate oxidase
MLARAQREPNIHIQPHCAASELLVEHGRVCGVRTNAGASSTGRAVILATGGYAALWARTTNAPGNRGQGLLMAWLAGASLADLELVQFHPTALDLPGQRAYLLSEALRGEGAQVVDAAGEPILEPLLPRDVLARAIHHYRAETGAVFLSLRHLDADHVRVRFAALAAELATFGLDLASDLIPISPAAHYCMGGIRTDADGRTSLPGLYATGEAACTGVQGANRLASNSLLECLVFGARAAQAALRDADDAHAAWSLSPLPRAETKGEGPGTPQQAALADLMVRDCGVERNGAALARLAVQLGPADATAEPLPAMVVDAALTRAESRGGHYRRDFPETDARWRGRIHWRRDQPPAFEPIL